MTHVQAPGSEVGAVRRALSVLAALVVAAAPALADTYPRQSQVDAVHYAFRLTLGDDSNEIAGEATITLQFTGAGVASVALDLASAADG
jgi:hypothetical protein